MKLVLCMPVSSRNILKLTDLPVSLCLQNMNTWLRQTYGCAPRPDCWQTRRMQQIMFTTGKAIVSSCQKALLMGRRCLSSSLALARR